MSHCFRQSIFKTETELNQYLLFKLTGESKEYWFAQTRLKGGFTLYPLRKVSRKTFLYYLVMALKLFYFC